MAIIDKQLLIAAPIDSVWAALTDPAAIMGWMGEDSAVSVDLRVGGRYQFFGGTTTGAFTILNAPRSLAYTWRQAEWQADWRDSIVRWDLEPAGAGTRVHLTHDQFPNLDERDSHDEGWDVYWLDPMKDWLEGEQGEPSER